MTPVGGAAGATYFPRATLWTIRGRRYHRRGRHATFRGQYFTFCGRRHDRRGRHATFVRRHFTFWCGILPPEGSMITEEGGMPPSKGVFFLPSEGGMPLSKSDIFTF